MYTVYHRLRGSGLLRALNTRAFLLIWGGQTLSRIGDHLYQVALAWWVLEKTGSAAAMAQVLIFAYAPMLIFLLVGGVTVDRFSRTRIMLISDLARGLVAGVVAALALVDGLEIAHIYVATLIFGFVDAFFQPAYTAAVPEVVHEDDLPSANSLTSISAQTGRILGPAIAAALIGLGGTPLAFTLNSLTFFISAVFLLPLLRQPAGQREASSAGTSDEVKRSSFWDDLREGLRLVVTLPFLWMTILLYSLTNILLSGPYSIALPFLVSDHMHAGSEVLGLLYAVFPIGYIIGGIWLGNKPAIRRRGLLIYGGMAVAALMLATFGLLLPLPLLVLAALVNGAMLEIGSLAWMNTLQELVPQDKLGRVSSVDNLGSFALLPVGYALTGWATDHLGAPMVFIVGGLVTAALGLLGLLHPRIRTLD